MGRLHRLPNQRQQLGVQLLQIGLMAQPVGEGFERLGRIVLPSIETPVYDVLETPPQRLEESGYSQGRSDDRQLCLLSGQRTEDILQQRDAAQVREREHQRERAVDEGPVDDHVYVVEPIA